MEMKLKEGEKHEGKLDGANPGQVATMYMDAADGQKIIIEEAVRQALDKFMEALKLSKPEQQLHRAAVVREIDAITPQEQRILDALHWLETVSAKAAFHPIIVAFFAKHSPDSTSFGNAKRSLRRKGFVDHTYAGHMQLSEEGRKYSKCVISIGPKVLEKVKLRKGTVDATV